MNDKAIFSIILSSVLGITFYYLAKVNRSAVPPDETGRTTLRLPVLYNIVGYVSLLIALFFSVGIFLVEEEDPLPAYVIMALMIGFFGWMAILCIRYYKNHRVSYDETGITVRNGGGTARSVEWWEITFARLNSITSIITLRSATGKKFGVHQHLRGLNDLIKELNSGSGVRVEGLPFLPFSGNS